MKRVFQHPPEPPTGKRYWRSLGEFNDTPEFRQWLEREFPPGAAELTGDEWSLDCEGFTLYVDAASMPYLDGANIDYETNATGGQLTVRAPKIKGLPLAENAELAGYTKIPRDADCKKARRRCAYCRITCGPGACWVDSED